MPVKKKIYILAALVFFGLLCGRRFEAQASNDLFLPPLSTNITNESSSNVLDEESYEKIKTLSESKSETQVMLTNITPRVGIRSLDFITGSTQDPEQEVWIFSLDNEKKVLQLGSTKSGKDKKFSLIPPVQPPYGEVFLVASLISDIRLGVALPEKMKVVSFYLRNDVLIDAATAPTLTILIDHINFSQNGVPLESLQSRFLEVYAPYAHEPITVHLSGQIYSDDTEGLQLTSVTLPNLEQNLHQYSTEAPHTFESEINVMGSSWEEDLQIILTAQKNDEAATNQVVSFRLKPLTEFPSAFKAFLESNRNTMTMGLFLLLIISLLLVSRTYDHQSRWARILSVLIILAEVAFIAYLLLIGTVTSLFEKGLINIPGQEMVLLQNQQTVVQQPTLTRLNEDLELSPGLSTSWSNIKPHIWEFILRQEVSAESIILEFQRKVQNLSSDRQYLASIKNMIGVNPDKLQIITHFPDPLLPQKLTKVQVSNKVDQNMTAQAFLPLQAFANDTRSRRNDHYYLLPFLKNVAEYQRIIKVEHPESIKQLIKTQTIDAFDEPNATLWPTLLQNNYRILPKINTESIMVLANRKGFFLREPPLVFALQKILKSPRILQTSYFQYGQLANQFVPPGVVGYDPEIKFAENTRTIPELLEEVKSSKQVPEITLTFQYPEQERTVARVVQQELELAGIHVIPYETPNKDYEKAIAQRSFDLTLLPLQFDIGDVGPFLDALIDSQSAYNKTYSNPRVDQLIAQSRSELNQVRRLELLQQIMNIIVHEDPAGIPLLFKRSFKAVKQPKEVSWWERFLQREILGWK